jgi:hypothetical protein
MGDVTVYSNPKARDSLTKYIQIARADTTAAVKAWLPRDAILSGLYVIGAVASDATTSASISVGTTATANEFIDAFDVKTAATGEGYNPAGAAAVGSAMATKLTVDTPVYAKYTFSGANTTGGPWTVKVEYFVTGPGETL